MYCIRTLLHTTLPLNGHVTDNMQGFGEMEKNACSGQQPDVTLKSCHTTESNAKISLHFCRSVPPDMSCAKGSGHVEGMGRVSLLTATP